MATTVTVVHSGGTVTFLRHIAATAGSKHWMDIPRVSAMKRIRLALQRAHSANVYLDRGKFGRMISFIGVWYGTDYNNALSTMLTDLDLFASSNNTVTVYDQSYSECEFLGEAIEAVDIKYVAAAIVGIAVKLQFRSYV